MKDVLNMLVQAINDQAIATGAVADQVTALKRTLARQFPDLADEIKAQIEVDHEQSRKSVYELQVSLGKLREAIPQLPDAQSPPEAREKIEANGARKRPAKVPARAAKRTAARVGR
jgi:hypothetical protein